MRISKNESKESCFFSNLFYLKQYQLMAENIHGEQFLNMDGKSKDAVQKISDIQELYAATENFMEDTKKSIPKEKFEEWEYGDSESYTDKYHHRKFPNEIENSCLVAMLLKKFVSLYDEIHVCDDEEHNGEKYNLRLYDFNDHDLYFSTEQDAETFASKFDPSPYTLYKQENGAWIERYSV